MAWVMWFLGAGRSQDGLPANTRRTARPGIDRHNAAHEGPARAHHVAHARRAARAVRDRQRPGAPLRARLLADRRLREISGVCTDPDFQGRGLARRLMLKLIRREVERGETPFLHVMRANDGARRLYRGMGFGEYAEAVVRVVSLG